MQYLTLEFAQQRKHGIHVCFPIAFLFHKLPWLKLNIIINIIKASCHHQHHQNLLHTFYLLPFTITNIIKDS